MILVTGAVGNVGRVLAKLLAERGTAFRVLVRRPDKYVAPSPRVEVFAGHFGAPDSLGPALDGVEELFLLSGVHPEMVKLQGNAVAAARTAGVRHIVKLSGMDASPESPLTLARWHGEVERLIEETGIDCTRLRPNIFMQNLLHQAASIGARGEVRAAMGTGQVSMIDVRDIAEAAASVLLEHGHERKAYTLTGPAAIGYDRVAQCLSEALGRSVRYVSLDALQAKREMLDARMPEWWADLLLELFGAAARGGCSAVTADVAGLLGRPARSCEQFARDHADAFRG